MRPKVRLWIRLVSLVSYPPHFETIPVMNVLFRRGYGTSAVLTFLKKPTVCCEHVHTQAHTCAKGNLGLMGVNQLSSRPGLLLTIRREKSF